jgi:hypothetical protein
MKKEQKIITTKYPRTLAQAETKSRRSYEQGTTTVDPADRSLLTNPNAFTLQNAYPYIFDGLIALCTDYADKTHTFKGKEIGVIQGQDDHALTHYQTIVPIEVFKGLALNGHNEYWDFLRVELYEMHKRPESRLLPFAPGLLIGTHPIEVDFIYDDGIKASTVKSLEKIGTDRKIKYLVLRFYKPLFASLLQRNAKGAIGNNYLQMPRALQAKLNARLKLIQGLFERGKEIDEGLKEVGLSPQAMLDHFVETAPDEAFIKLGLNPANRRPRKAIDHAARLAAAISLTAIEARKIFLFLACHDDNKSSYISLNPAYDQFLIGCFPGLVEIRKAGSVYIKPKNRELINKKLDGFVYLFSLMGTVGELNGAQFLPLAFDILNKRVEVERNKALCYNKQTEPST